MNRNKCGFKKYHFFSNNNNNNNETKDKTNKYIKKQNKQENMLIKIITINKIRQIK